MPKVKTPTERFLKVTYHPESISKGKFSDRRKQTYGTTAKPRLLLCGFWLFQAGFEVGSMVSVSVKKGRLIIKSVANSNQ
jgi:hypothetical protein